MLTGRRAFDRESRIKTLAAVLNEEPPPAAAANEAVPPELERILNRCLRKDPQRRWQTMSDLKIALQDLKEDSESGRLLSAGGVHNARRQILVFAIAAASVLVLAAVAAVVLKLFIFKPAGPVEYEISPLTFDSGITAFLTIPRVGSLMAFSSDGGGGRNLDLWIQQLAGASCSV